MKPELGLTDGSYNSKLKKQGEDRWKNICG
nr:MAG TPA: hypothetical protein [Caudoviricetes sp.]DAX90994.1 MAG TPA: hypothetical protein [Caudoviricetes sp.]DAX98426.1 MAG TPA: hypothetical protein [Caudoviricetes sp.]